MFKQIVSILAALGVAATIWAINEYQSRILILETTLEANEHENTMWRRETGRLLIAKGQQPHANLSPVDLLVFRKHFMGRENDSLADP